MFLRAPTSADTCQLLALNPQPRGMPQFLQSPAAVPAAAAHHQRHPHAKVWQSCLSVELSWVHACAVSRCVVCVACAVSRWLCEWVPMRANICAQVCHFTLSMRVLLRRHNDHSSQNVLMMQVVHVLNVVSVCMQQQQASACDPSHGAAGGPAAFLVPLFSVWMWGLGVDLLGRPCACFGFSSTGDLAS